MKGKVFGGALIVRLLLLGYGYLQDNFMTVKYTDVDYEVYTDAAREVANGNSPYDRTTYRYTPILAYLLLPNIYLHEIYGKLLFVFCDLFAGYLLYKILLLRGLESKSAFYYTSMWLFHPFSINISTRGNADSIVVLLVLLTLYFFMQRKLALAALAYGSAVHFKIYPIVYALAFLVCLDEDFNTANRRPPTSSWIKKVFNFFNKDRICFGLISGFFFFFLLGLFYQMYGFQFLYEAYLYHFTRTDNRHNFSVYFYDLYLRYNTPSGFGVGLMAFLPQFASLVTISIIYGKDLIFAHCALTMCFVMFNKVCTAQYFLWYIVFFPVILPSSTLEFKWKGLLMILIGFGGELFWLFWAFHLEMKGKNTFLQIWIAGLFFFLINVGLLVILMRHQLVKSLFQQEKITFI